MTINNIIKTEFWLKECQKCNGKLLTNGYDCLKFVVLKGAQKEPLQIGIYAEYCEKCEILYIRADKE